MNQRHVFGEVLTLETAIAAFVFLVILGLLAFSVVRRRAGAGVTASQRAERTRLESSYLAGLAVVAVFLVAYTAYANHREQQPDEKRATTRVDVTAFQWCWSFQYPDGQSKPVTVSGNCRDGQFPTLVVPTGSNVEVRLTSKDVIHSMWIPALRYKMDAFPHHTNGFTMTFDHEGRWRGRCAEFCGLRHRTMDFWVKAVSPKKYKQWLASHGGTTGAAV
ncbi:cytochrome c oxidase subunit II [Streptomyces sp. 7R007]